MNNLLRIILLASLFFPANKIQSQTLNSYNTLFDRCEKMIQNQESIMAQDLLDSLVHNTDMLSNPDNVVRFHLFQGQIHAQNGEATALKDELTEGLSLIDSQLDSINDYKSEIYTLLIDTYFLIDADFANSILAQLRTYLNKYNDPIGENNYLRLKGVSEALIGKWHSAVSYYERSMIEPIFYSEKAHSSALLNLEFFYGRSGQPYKELELANRAMFFVENMKVPDHNALFNVYNNAAVREHLPNETPSNRIAYEYALKALHHASLAKNKDAISNAMLTCTNSRLLKYLDTNNKEYLNEALNFYDSIVYIQTELKKDPNNKPSPVEKATYDIFCDLSLREKKPLRAQSYLDKSKNLNRHYELKESRTFWRQAQIEDLKYNYVEAIKNWKQAICLEYPPWSQCSTNKVQDQNVKMNGLAAVYFNGLANSYYRLYQGTNKKSYLLESQKSFVDYDAAVESIYAETGNPLDIEYHIGIDIIHDLYINNPNTELFNQAIVYAEKQKNFFYLKNLESNKFLKYSVAPDSAKLRLAYLKEEMDYRQNLSDKAATEDDGDMLQKRSALVAATTKYNSYQKDYSELYPTITNSITSNISETSNIVQKYQNVITDELTIEYQFGRSNLYAFVLGNGIREFVSLNIDKAQIDSLINIYRISIIKKDNTHESIAIELYNKLFQPIEGFITQKNIVIIPDDILLYIPFDLLINNQKEYLIYNYSIRYLNSILWQSTKEKNPLDDIAGMFAFAASPGMANFISFRDDVTRAGLEQLVAAKKEVQTLKQKYKGKFLAENDATETYFKQNASHYKAIHLAMHGLIDADVPSNSHMVFNQERDSLNDGNLKAHEIYNLDITADLVTLSACNSGYGNIGSGGLSAQSLSSAFILAGAKSVLSSLWSVHDEATYQLMSNFYEAAGSNISKHEALRQAKIQYLKSQPKVKSHPYFWGGFVYYGDNDVLNIEQKSYSPILITALFVLLLLSIFGFRKIIM